MLSMKYVNKIVIGLALCMGLTTACKDDDETGISGGIAVDKEEIAIGAEGGTEKIAVTSSTNWIATSCKAVDCHIAGKRIRLCRMQSGN